MINKSPLVSIGLPIYNSQKTIIRALNSLLAQDYPNFEIIVSDNASTDQTAEICREYAEKDNRIRIHVNEKNFGIINNFMAVCKKATGKYFMWAGGDDFWEPSFISILVAELEANPSAGVALCAVRREYRNGQVKDTIKYNGRSNPNNLSNLQLAANLLSPKKQTRMMKFNLFIYGLFRFEAIKRLLPIAKEMFDLGERAFLSPIALSYRFRYVDKPLFVRTVYKEPYRKRDPEEEVYKYRKSIKFYKYFYYYKVMLWIIKYSKIKWKNKIFVFAILYYIANIFLTNRVKKIDKRKKKILKILNK